MLRKEKRTKWNPQSEVNMEFMKRRTILDENLIVITSRVIIISNIGCKFVPITLDKN